MSTYEQEAIQQTSFTEDVGQMDMYVRMYDELKKAPDDNPTIGIVLCSETDEDIKKWVSKINLSSKI